MNIPVNFFYWFLSIIPILVLLILMIKFQWGAPKAALFTLTLTIIISFLFFKANIEVVSIEILKALWNSLSIILVVITAILLYEVSDEAGAFEILNKTFKKIAPNELIRIMMIGVVFASFLQGVTGFGVPVLVSAPLLIQIGVSPLWAVVIPLIGHSWAGTFGTLAIAWNALIFQTGIDNITTIREIALYGSGLLFMLGTIANITIAYFYGGFRAIKKGFIAILLISLVQGGGQVIISQFNPDLSAFIPSALSLISLILLSRSPLYKDKWMIEDSKIMKRKEQNIVEEIENKMNMHEAFLPYYLMSFITLSVLLIKPINNSLSKFSYGPSFIETKTGFGIVNEFVSQYSPITPFTHAGMFLFSASMLGYIYYRKKGFINKGKLPVIFKKSIKKAIPPILAVISLISISRVMSGTGQTLVLAEGISNVLGEYYVIFAPFIGFLGSFITGSNMSSNILFADFQMLTSKIIGLNTPAILGSQTAGGGVGMSIAPGNIVLGTTTANILGSEGKVLKKILPFTISIATLFGILMFISHILNI